MTRGGSDPTLPASGDGTDATLASDPAGAGLGETMASAPARSKPPIVIRAGNAGRTDDYDALVGVDPTHYVVGTELARGGMGRIMTARDRRLGRPVAIKELLYASGDARARFEREARITARLQHPSIVNILEAGTWPSGEPFYVMKLVAGSSLDKVIAQKQTLAERLGLLPTIIAVVDALAYAHSMRVIHRDLKPGNVLVGEFGETVVIDWGLAKDLTDSSAPDVDVGPYREAHNPGETVAGAVMGTPAYMPAEQASGDTVDERADVYALGAMLYHVLAGAAPYTGKSIDDLLAKVIQGPPPSLASRAPDVPPDLVTIVNKAMAHAANDRYVTAGKLAEDLKRFQTGQLVAAHQYSTWQLVRRWVRRHKAPVAVATIAALVLAVGGVVSVRSIMTERNTANRARAEADAQRLTADQRRIEADTRRKAAQHLVDYMLVELKKELEPIGKLKILEGVGEAVEEYFALTGQSAPDADADPTDRRNRAEALLLVSTVQDGKGNSEAALATVQTSQRLIEGLIAEAPDDADLQNKLALALESQGWIHEHMDHPDDARAAYLAAIAVKERMIAADPAKLRWKANLATTFSALGWLDLNRGNALDALPSMKRSREILQEVVAVEPDNLLYVSNLSLGYNAVGYAEANLGQMPEAIDDFREAVAIAERVFAKAPDNSVHLDRLAQLTLDLGKAYSYGGQPREAREHTVRAIDLTKQLIARDPDNVGWAARLPNSYQSAAELDLQAGDYRPALELSLAGIEASDAVVARGDDASARYFRALLHVNVVRARLGLGDAEGVARAYDAALEAWTQWHKDDAAVEHKQIAFMDQAVGEDEANRGRHARASIYFEHGIAELEPLVSASPDDAELTVALAVLYEKRAVMHMAQKDLPAAEAAYMKKLELALALYERTQLPVGAVTAAYSYEGLAALLTPTRPDEALAFARKGTELLLKLQAAGALSATDETLLASLKARVPD